MAARRVLVTDSDERSALAACRGLAAAGFDVTAGVSVRPSPGAWSRAVRRRVRLPEPRLDEAAFVAALERELRKQPHDALLCATEAAALAVSVHRDRVEGLCRGTAFRPTTSSSAAWRKELIVVDSEFATIDFNPRIYGSMALAEAAGANLAAIWCDHLLDGGAATTAARAGVRYRFDDAEARNALSALRRGRLGEFLGICRPRARVTHAYFRWSDPGPFAGRVAQLCWNGLRRARPRTAAPGDPLGFRVRVQTLAAEAFHWLLAYAVGVPLVLLARLARLLKHAGASR